MVSLEQGFISGNITCGTSEDAVEVKELHRSGECELKQPIILRFLIDSHVISLLVHWRSAINNMTFTQIVHFINTIAYHAWFNFINSIRPRGTGRRSRVARRRTSGSRVARRRTSGSRTVEVQLSVTSTN
jgi:hypothetical protein